MTVAARNNAAVFLALVLLALLGFFRFPGHTFLQSDTQIYVPMFERIEHPGLYQGDPLMDTMHVALTIYDETAIFLHHITGLGFEQVLEGEQIVMRVLGLWGVFLIAASAGCGEPAALLVAAFFGLGATIVGPAVLSIEYEPVPRGFAISLLMLATGLALQGRLIWACTAAAAATLFHAPASWPFWPLFAICCRRGRTWKALAPLAAGLFILAVAYLRQPGAHRSQPWFQKIDPVWEAIMRFRVSYDWLDLWPDFAIVNFMVMAALALAALWRIRPSLTHWVLLGGFPVLGALSIAISAIALDWGKWSLMSQVQPARAALFAVVFAGVNCSLAGVRALEHRRIWEAVLWLVPVALIPVKQNFANGFTTPQLATIAGLVTLAAACFLVGRGMLAWLVLAATASWMIPAYAGVTNFPDLHNPDLAQLSDWARTATPETALFEFPVAQRSLEQGVFRARALRPWGVIS